MNAEDLKQAEIKIAKMEVQIDTLTQAIDDLKDSNQQLQAKLDQVLLTLSEARGGWRMMMLVGGAGTTLGAAAAWVLQHFGGR